MTVRDIIEKSLSGEEISAQEIKRLFEVQLFTEDSAFIQVASYQKSQRACRGLTEVHAQVGINISPCPRDCLFCAFAIANKVFNEPLELTVAQALDKLRQFEQDGANAVFLMSTGNYPFSRFFEMSQEIRKGLKEQTVMVANVGDFSLAEAKKLKACGYTGIYHAVRLGEGRDTKIKTEKRLETFRNAKEAGLLLGTCLEPVGSEHSIDELVEKTIITRDAKPVFSGAARRIPIPNTKLGYYPIVSEARMAHILAVVRLALGYDVPGNCTHEPNVIGCAAGANLLWAEVGSNPRDTQQETQQARGMNVGQCRAILKEAEWKVLDGPSVFYREKN